MHRIHFQLREDKAADAAAEVIRLEGGHADMIRVIKLLYLVDRKSLEKRDRPITGDAYCSMKHGPVLSRIYDLVKEREPAVTGPWHLRIRREQNTLAVNSPDALGALSQEDLDIIAEVVREHRGRGTWELCDWTHLLPEWEEPGSSSAPIRIERVLEALKKTPEEIEQIAIREEGLAAFHKVIGVE